MIHLPRLVQLLFTIGLLGGFRIRWTLFHDRNSHPPDGGFLLWWSELEGQPEFQLLEPQLVDPVYWWLNRNVEWSALWRVWRMVHLWLLLLLLLLVFLLLLATPDLGGHWG